MGGLLADTSIPHLSSIEHARNAVHRNPEVAASGLD
jgi:hypothetical protein